MRDGRSSERELVGQQPLWDADGSASERGTDA